MFWGLTPCLDLTAEYQKHISEPPEELNVLIVGGSDARHVLQTLAKRYRHRKVTINLYLTEACMENVARHVLLLYIALQPTEELGLVQKCYTFMELYGNALIRPNVAKYLQNAARGFVKFVTNYDELRQIMPFLNFELKYKERDYLENVFKFWCSDDEFAICDYWDRRMRKNLGVRYDNKEGAFDWDLHMRLHTIGGQQVASQEYRNFRMNGVAFSWLESDVSKTNRSLVCAVVPNGERFAHHGYLGDMSTGPFVPYGLQCEDEEFLKKKNGFNSHRATDVTERNLKQIFYELENQSEYLHQKTSDVKGGSIVKACERKVVDAMGCNAGNKCSKKCIDVKDTIINLISTQTLQLMEHRSNYHKMFDVIYFSSSHLKYFDQNVVQKIAKEKSLLIIENKKFVLSLRDKDLEGYENQVDVKLKNCDFQKLKFDVHKDDYLLYVLQ